MRKLMRFFLVGVIALAAVNCGGSGTTPASIEKSIYSQFQKGNYEKGIKLYFENLADAGAMGKQDEMISAFAEKAKESFDAKGGIKDFEIIEERIDDSGEKAVVVSRITYGDGTEKEESNKYIKVDEQWKIAGMK